MRTSRRLGVAFAGVLLLLFAGLGSATARSTGMSGLLSGLSGKLRAVFALPGRGAGGRARAGPASTAS